MDKECLKCHIVKDIDNFYLKVGKRRAICKECCRIYNGNFYKRNGKVIKECSQRYRANNREKVNTYHKRYQKVRRASDTNFKLIKNLRKQVWGALKESKNIKISRTEQLLGCSLDFFINYITLQFSKGMEWSNYGKGGWDLDHIRPLSSFKKLDSIDEQKVAFNYKNYQPLWHVDNLKKGAKYAIREQREEGSKRQAI